MIVSKKTVTIVHRWLAFVLGVFVVFQVTSGSIAQEAICAGSHRSCIRLNQIDPQLRLLKSTEP